MKIIECLICTVSASVAFPQAKSGCGVDELGVARKSGDSWQEECNRCRCLPSGVPGCTKKLCGSVLGFGNQCYKSWWYIIFLFFNS